MEETKYSTILYEKDKEVPHILYITLNRPEKGNAISIGPGEMTDELQQAIHRANNDAELKVIIFRGAGRNFSAGFDLSMVYRVYGGAPGVRPPQATRLQVDWDHIVGMPRTLLHCAKVTMAQIHGWCIEAGMFIPECCDIAIAAKNALFAHRGQRLAFGGMPFMPLELLQGHTKKITELLITGRTVTAVDAEQMGIITKAVEPEDLESECYNLAKAVCLLPLDAIHMGKLHRRLLYEVTGMNSSIANVVFHTMATNLTYQPYEKDIVFIRDRESMGAKGAFHKLHDAYTEALNKTKNFREASPE